VARYDKYEPYAGGFRAPLAADWLASDLDTVIGVGLNGSGQVVKGAGTSGIVGAIVLTKARKAKEIVDVMTDGEIVDFDKVGRPSGAFASAPGTAYYAATSGAVSSTASGGVYVGHTVEKSRLVVRVRPGEGA
jgi:hypothetical protein